MAKFNLHVKASYCSYNVALLYVLGMDHWKKSYTGLVREKFSSPMVFIDKPLLQQ